MWRHIRWLLYTLLLFALVGTQALAERSWKQIVNASSPFVDRNGVSRTPSCSGGPEKTPFSFFIREGDPRKLVIALDGGGACWDGNTCVGSVLTRNPIYELEIDETPESLEELGGIGDITDLDNPLRKFTQVFIPYCTGDIHWGSKVTSYDYTAPDGTTLNGTIHHRGFDNLLAVLKWLSNHYQSEIGYAPKKVVVAGSSAGGYGVLLALPAIKRLLPQSARTFLLADSANGVISDDFYHRALGGNAVSGGAWGVEQNIPDFLLGAFASGADSLAVSTYTTLAWRYPLIRFGQYTRAWDEVQIFYTNVGNNVEFPERWNDPSFLLPTAVEWTIKARAYMHLSALAPNYRFYIAAGTDHTLLADDSFYKENSAQGVSFSNWVDDMVNRRWPRGSDWRNVSCVPHCLK